MEPQIEAAAKPVIRPRASFLSCRIRGLALALSLAGQAMLVPAPVIGQPAAPPRAGEVPVAVPGFWDPRRRPERPDLSRVSILRFMTEYDYPPFNYVGSDGAPTGFNVELARLICEELKLQCTIQMRRFDTLIDALAQNRGDAIIASIVPTPELRQRVDFTGPYYRTPARFVARRDGDAIDVVPERLEGRKVAVVAGTAHEAFLKAFFTEADVRPMRSVEVAREALRRGEVEFLFGDGVQLALWLNGADSGNCCTFRGGPYTESSYFGEGVGIAVRKGNDALRQGIDWALFRLWEKGRFTDLWLRYFPLNPF